jgi:hypothetical protein
MIRVVHPGFLPILDPGVKKAPDLGSGSVTLYLTYRYRILKPLTSMKRGFESASMQTVSTS